MNDLYLEIAKPDRDDANGGSVQCSECAAPLNILDDRVVVVSTANDLGELYCDECAENIAKAFPGNIRDRREDAEALLRETADVLHAARTQGVLAQSDTATHLLALAARMV